MSVYIGNAERDGAQFRQWFVGDLSGWGAGGAGGVGSGVAGSGGVDGAALRDTRSVGIKWGIHPKGQARPGGWADGDVLTTISVLVSGHFVITFEDREAHLQSPGEYAMWSPGVRHTWRAEADSVVLTVRFRPG